MNMNMNIVNIGAGALLSILTPLAGHCSSMLPAAHVLAFGTYGNGNVYVTLDQAVDQVGCATPSLEFPANAAALKNILTVAAIALTTGRPVVVQVDGCYASNTATFTGVRNGAALGLAQQ